MSLAVEVFAAAGVALYAGHHVGDYWVQTDHQAAHKGDAGSDGRRACVGHVASYLLTQGMLLSLVSGVLGMRLHILPMWAALAVSGATHYMADRRERGLMYWLVRHLGKVNFWGLGKPRPLQIYAQSVQHGEPHGPVPLDNPSLGTGAWALDQSWHIFWGVFVAALVLARLS